jgi:hypothetical protein
MKVIALDLEQTLISNAVSQFPRPGLYDFLNNCRTICKRIVIFTAVKEPLFRAIAATLVEEGFAPGWFAEVEYIVWTGPRKNLNFITDATPSEVILVDDFRDYIEDGHENSWVEIAPFIPPYSDDGELNHAFELILEKFIKSKHLKNL